VLHAAWVHLQISTMTEIETEAVLTVEDLRSILKVCSTEGVLVGGQALAFWADHFALSRPADLVIAVSADADFIADGELARKLARQLGWKSWIPGFDDATFQTGKVTKKLPDGSVKQVDFLASVAGLATEDVVRRALEMEVPEIGRLRVMHPVDVLDSRIQNLARIPSKRTPAGVSQARLAIDAARAFVASEIDERGERKALQLLERIAEIAADNAAIRVFTQYGVDPLNAVPIEEFRTTTALHAQRWPQIVAGVGKKREKLRGLKSRSAPKRKI
jgi:hypothetical protein